MEYTEHPPPPALRRHVQCLWVLRDDAPGDEVQVIYPDGCCELLAELGVPLRFRGADGEVRSDQPVCFAAQQRGPIRLQAAGAVHCIGVRLRPASSALVAGTRLPGLRDQAPDLYTLDPVFAAAFSAAARNCVGKPSPEPLWGLLQARCAGFAPDLLAERAVAMLDAVDGGLRIAGLARQLGVAPRTLQTRFLAAVGLTPKEYARVRRLQALLRTLDREAAAIVDAAMRHGYSDQAHATHELLDWTGWTPARLARALRGDRGGEEAVRLAAAFVRGSHAGTAAAEGESGQAVAEPHGARR
ncbi:helix-turn-helix transcriptional regulator [Stenotrophomonas mori]|uniref:Helix-turn-helix transcriptional regulator n=1 Tax=Stenotrophomonas mori TaxID=2871096 RepID=A0ABT0SEZ4_9GAMM|nr:helix-turn-helix transcriptional regulator [Stenotrophomonas mori]MCL7713890.1 helix-turn-helix transcriptional regulator [Stenotrophomonas mori]